MVERGEFIYDRSGRLGSRLRTMRRLGVPQNASGLEMLIREALEPMTDIAVTDVIVNTFGDGSDIVKDPRLFAARINYSILFALDDQFVTDDGGQVTTQVEIPI